MIQHKHNTDILDTLTAKRTKPSIANFIPAWAAGVSYLTGDLTLDNGKIQRSLTDHVSLATFALDTAAWEEISASSTLASFKEVAQTSIADYAATTPTDAVGSVIQLPNGTAYILKTGGSASTFTDWMPIKFADNAYTRTVVVTTDADLAAIMTAHSSSPSGTTFQSLDGKVWQLKEGGTATVAGDWILLGGAATVATTNTLTASASGIVSTVNGTAATLTPPAGTVQLSIGFDANGELVKQAINFDAIINFAVNADPNTALTTFTPNTPALTTVLYVSTIDNTQWTYNGTTYVTPTNAPSWDLAGNAGTVQSTNFIGTTDNIGLSLRTNNIIRQTITDSGLVGIGTTTPLVKLHNNGGFIEGAVTTYSNFNADVVIVPNSNFSAYLFNQTTNNIDIGLLSGSSNEGQVASFKLIGTATGITLNGEPITYQAIRYQYLNGEWTPFSKVQTPITADNGLTKIGDNIELGGTLLHDTIIDAATIVAGVGYDLTVNNAKGVTVNSSEINGGVGEFKTEALNSKLTVFNANDLETAGLENSQIAGTNANLFATSISSGQTNKITLRSTEIDIKVDTNSDLKINGSSGTANQYFGSNGAGLPPTWQTIADATTADNGLTKIANNIELGGTLVQATSIDGGNHQLSITDTQQAIITASGAGALGEFRVNPLSSHLRWSRGGEAGGFTTEENGFAPYAEMAVLSDNLNTSGITQDNKVIVDGEGVNLQLGTDSNLKINGLTGFSGQVLTANGAAPPTWKNIAKTVQQLNATGNVTAWSSIVEIGATPLTANIIITLPSISTFNIGKEIILKRLDNTAFTVTIIPSPFGNTTEITTPTVLNTQFGALSITAVTAIRSEQTGNIGILDSGNSIADWSASTAYTTGTYVNAEGRIYKCITSHTSISLFDDNPNILNWQYVGGYLVESSATPNLYSNSINILQPVTGTGASLVLASGITTTVANGTVVKIIDGNGLLETDPTVSVAIVPQGSISDTINGSSLGFSLKPGRKSWEFIYDATNNDWKVEPDKALSVSTKTSNYTYLESDEIIEVNTTASVVTITLPNTLITGKKVTVIWIAGANALTIVSTKNMIDFDGVPKLSVTPAALNTAYSWLNGSVNFQLV